MRCYKCRICDKLLSLELQGSGAVVIEGAKWCGKTTTAEQQAKSVVYIDEPGKLESNVILSSTKPERLLDGTAPRLIDEWQLAPALWDVIRYRCDHSNTGGYLTDPSIAAASLGEGPMDLMNDIKTFGYLFETMAVRDLRVYAQSLNGLVSHYLDASGLECNAVVHLRNGSYGLVEIKLGGKELIEKGARTLCRLADRIDMVRMKAPSFKMVLTATGDFAYCRPQDGVIVCPLSALRP